MATSARTLRSQNKTFLRLMVLGPPKAGKSIAAIATAPGPVRVLNCDGLGAQAHVLDYMEDDFSIDDIDSLSDLEKAINSADRDADKGDIKTIVFDTLTLYEKRVIKTNILEGEYGFDKWFVYENMLVKPLGALLNIAAHVIVTAHGEGPAGGIPAITGKAASVVGGMFHDVVCVRFDPKEGVSELISHPQGAFGTGCRSLRGSFTVKPASIKAFIDLVAKKATTAQKRK